MKGGGLDRNRLWGEVGVREGWGEEASLERAGWSLEEKKGGREEGLGGMLRAGGGVGGASRVVAVGGWGVATLQGVWGRNGPRS